MTKRVLTNSILLIVALGICIALWSVFQDWKTTQDFGRNPKTLAKRSEIIFYGEYKHVGNKVWLDIKEIWKSSPNAPKNISIGQEYIVSPAPKDVGALTGMIVFMESSYLGKESPTEFAMLAVYGDRVAANDMKLDEYRAACQQH